MLWGRILSYVYDSRSYVTYVCTILFNHGVWNGNMSTYQTLIYFLQSPYRLLPHTILVLGSVRRTKYVPFFHSARFLILSFPSFFFFLIFFFFCIWVSVISGIYGHGCFTKLGLALANFHGLLLYLETDHVNCHDNTQLWKIFGVTMHLWPLFDGKKGNILRIKSGNLWTIYMSYSMNASK